MLALEKKQQLVRGINWDGLGNVGSSMVEMGLLGTKQSYHSTHFSVIVFHRGADHTSRWASALQNKKCERETGNESGTQPHHVRGRTSARSSHTETSLLRGRAGYAEQNSAKHKISPSTTWGDRIEASSTVVQDPTNGANFEKSTGVAEPPVGPSLLSKNIFLRHAACST